MASESNYVQALADHLQDGLEGLTADPATTVWNVNDRSVLGNRALAVKQIQEILVESEQVFLHEDAVVFEQRSEKDDRRLLPLLQGDTLVSSAPAHLANLFHCAVPRKGQPVTYQPPAKLV